MYAAIALAGVLPALLHPGATVGDGVDAFGTHWFYWWMRVCIEHLGDPSWTDLFFYPSGKDIFSHTGNNLVDAVLSVPFQWALGPTLYQPVFLFFVQLGNVAAFRALAGEVLGEEGIAPFAASALWMTNPFTVFEITAGRPTQAFLWFVPVAILFFLRCARQPQRRNAVLLGVAMALAGWTYWFNGYFLALAFVPLGIYELRDAADRRGTLLRWGLGALVCGALILPAAWKMVAAYEADTIPGLPSVAAGIFELPKGLGNNVSAELHGLWLLERYGAPQFLQPAWGLPVLAAMFWPGLPFARSRWIAVMLVALIVAIGPAIGMGADAVAFPPYMVLYRHLPFFNRLWFPYRIVVIAFIPAALLLGALCTRRRWLLPALGVLSLAGQVVTATWPFSWHHARAPEMMTSLRKEGGAVVFLPMKIQHDGLMWQTEFELPTFGGMGESASIFWTKDFNTRLRNGFVKALRSGAMYPAKQLTYHPLDRTRIEDFGFRWVVLRLSLLESELERHEDQSGKTIDRVQARRESVDTISAVAGHAPAGLDGDALLWDLRGEWVPAEAWRYSEERFLRREWDLGTTTTFEDRLRSLGRSGTPRTQAEKTMRR